MIEVFPIGTHVTIDGDIPATIRGITIYSEHWVKYQCVWWDERVRKEEWLAEDEIKPEAEHRKVSIQER